MQVETSVGDLLDKLSILDIKQARIEDPKKQAEIQKELTALAAARVYAERYPIWYATLVALNTRMWDLTNELKMRTELDAEYAKNAFKIMDFNQRRFRVKNVLNRAEATSLKEQKSYESTSIVIEGRDLWQVVYAATLYDRVYTHTVHLELPDVLLRADPSVPAAPLQIPEDEIAMYRFPPIRYVSGGMIGDFIHQLSVVYETYRKTGRKGQLFLADFGGPWRRGSEAAFQDLAPVLMTQPYIDSFAVYRGEPTDVNLSAWRAHPSLYDSSWARIFEDTYHVPWGTRPWLHVERDPAFSHVTFLSITGARPCGDLDFAKIFSKLPGQLIFLATEPGQESYFVNRFRIASIPVLYVSTFQELARAIGGCRLFVGTLSMPLALADALGVDRIALMPDSPDRLIASRTPKPFIFTMQDADRLL